MRHNIAGIELVGLLGGFKIRPIVRRLQETAELALLPVEFNDLGDRVVERAADDAAGLNEPVDRVVPGEIGIARRDDLVEIVEPFQKAETGIGARLIAALSDVLWPTRRSTEGSTRRLCSAAIYWATCQLVSSASKPAGMLAARHDMPSPSRPTASPHSPPRSRGRAAYRARGGRGRFRG